MSIHPDRNNSSSGDPAMGHPNGALHPGASVLQEFLAGRLPQMQSVQIEGHLSVCQECSRVFEAISSEQAKFALGLRSNGTPQAENATQFYENETIPHQSSERKVPTELDTADRPARGPKNKIEPTNLPQRFGRYRVESLLGRGGFGEVYRAWDEDLHRPVAIKVTLQRFLSGDSKDHYLSEARTVARLDHPNIVPVFDTGQNQQGDYYVVSKLIEGTDLSRRLTENRVGREAALSVIVSIAEALHYAHSQGLVHRDVKPGNILLDNKGKAFLADFGIALAESQLGKAEGIAGTVNYMSPEQARGEGHRVDGRSDIYSLGVVLYELLIGRRPFQSANPYDLLALIANNDVKPPRQFDDSISPEVERICLKALARSVKDRYSTAKDFADELKATLSPVHAQPPIIKSVNHEKEVRRVERHSLMSVRMVGGTVALLLGLLLVIYSVKWVNDSRADSGHPIIAPEGFKIQSDQASHQALASSDPSDPSDVNTSVGDSGAQSGVTKNMLELVKRFDILVSRDSGPFQPADKLAPLRTGDHVRFSIEFSAPVYTRLLWIDADGHPEELFPTDPFIGHRGSEVVTKVESPVELDTGWPVQGNPGMETAVLLISRSPLENLPLSNVTIKPSEMSPFSSIALYHATQEEPPVASDLGVKIADGKRSLGHSPKRVDDAVMSLLESLRKHADIVQAVSIKHETNSPLP